MCISPAFNAFNLWMLLISNNYHLISGGTFPLHKAVNLPAFLLSIPNNMHSYYKTHNKLGLEYRDLMEFLKDKEPSFYYSDVLIPNEWTLGRFIEAM